MREMVLAALMEKIGKYVSGEQLSVAIGCTRAAIWKQIRTLRENGYKIEATPRLGYRLIFVPDIIEPYFIKQMLDTRHIGREVRQFETLDSTNERAKLLAEHAAPHGLLVLSEEQSMGRGRMGKVWSSPKSKGVWMSLVLRPALGPNDAQKITIMAAVAMAQTIVEETGMIVGAKWPNDLIINNKKVCGILTEMSTSVDQLRYCILGIGLNVNATQEDFPQELSQVATSLKLQANGRDFSRVPFIVGFCNRLENLLNAYVETRDFAPVMNAYRPMSVTLGHDVHVVGPNMDIEGTALYFDDDGLLVVLNRNGRRERIFSGEAHVRGLMGY